MYPWTPVAEPGRNPARNAVAAVALPVYILGTYDISFTSSGNMWRTPWYWRDLEFKQPGSGGSMRFRASPATMARPWAGMALLACGYWYARDHMFGK